MDGFTTAGGAFGKTRWATVRAAPPAAAPRKKSLEELAVAYWRPIYVHFRRRGGKSRDEALSLTRTFLSGLGDLKSEEGRFRLFVQTSLERFVPRAGAEGPEIGEGFEPTTTSSPEEAFVREWARCVMGAALRLLEEECRASKSMPMFEALRLRDIAPPAESLDDEALAGRIGVRPEEVTPLLLRARTELRERVLHVIRDTVATEADAAVEMKELFG